MEVHRYLIKALRGGPEETYPDQLAAHVEAALKSERQKMPPNPTPSQAWENTSIVKWAVGFDSMESTLRPMWQMSEEREKGNHRVSDAVHAEAEKQRKETLELKRELLAMKKQMQQQMQRLN